MIATPQPANPLTMRLCEGIMALAVIGLSMAMPHLGTKWFAHIETALKRLALRRTLSVAVVGLTAFLLRLALLPLCPVPTPFAPDDFSFLLAADTFAHGRLTNPTPVMWTHFESLQITMVPSYMSMYFPAQGLLLAAGKVLLGHPWYALLFADALMCSAICWMLQAWLPASWALLGGFLAVLRLGLFSYWINTYTGAGCISALGGALVLGTLPRIRKSTRPRDCLLLATGIILLLYSRPYEGLLVCVPVVIALVHWICFTKHHPTPSVLIRRSALPLALVVAAIAWLAYYDQRNFGNPLTLPYTVNRATYAVAPYWIWESPRPIPVYRHKEMHDFYVKGEFQSTSYYHTVSGFLLVNLFKPVGALRFLAGATFFPALFFAIRALRDRRVRFFVLALLIWLPGIFIVIFLLPHYLAPFTAAFYVFLLQSLRHLRVWKLGRLPVGRTMIRLMILSCVTLAGLRALAGPLHIALAPWPGSRWVSDWYGPGDYGAARLHLEQYLARFPGKKLVLVRYANDHESIDEWVYNAANIDDSNVIWAHDMGADQNDVLIRYYKNRSVWLMQPDIQLTALSPYPTDREPKPSISNEVEGNRP